MNDENDVFWMVWCPHGHSPTVRHATRTKAANEAKRLARENPDREFYVLEAQERFQVETLRRTVLVHPIPF